MLNPELPPKGTIISVRVCVWTIITSNRLLLSLPSVYENKWWSDSCVSNVWIKWWTWLALWGLSTLELFNVQQMYCHIESIYHFSTGWFILKNGWIPNAWLPAQSSGLIQAFIRQEWDVHLFWCCKEVALFYFSFHQNDYSFSGRSYENIFEGDLRCIKYTVHFW